MTAQEIRFAMKARSPVIIEDALHGRFKGQYINALIYKVINNKEVRLVEVMDYNNRSVIVVPADTVHLHKEMWE